MKPFPSIAQSIGISLLLVAFIIAGVIMTYQMGYNFSTNVYAMLIVHVLCTGGVAALFTIVKMRNEKRQIVHTNLPGWRVMLLVVLATLSAVVVVAVPIINLIPMSDQIKEHFATLAKLTGPTIIILMGVSAPIFEEWIFRGIILDGLLRRYNPVTSIVLSSVLFGFVHLNPWQFITAFVVGLIVGWAYFRTGSLLLCVIVHASVNLTAFTVRQFVSTDAQPDMWTYLVNGIVMVVSIILLYRRFSKRAPIEWRAQPSHLVSITQS